MPIRSSEYLRFPSPNLPSIAILVLSSSRSMLSRSRSIALFFLLSLNGHQASAPIIVSHTADSTADSLVFYRSYLHRQLPDNIHIVFYMLLSVLSNPDIHCTLPTKAYPPLPIHQPDSPTALPQTHTSPSPCRAQSLAHSVY